MKCLICGKDLFDCIHCGTRDIENINVMKCKACGMVQLDSIEYNTEENYEGGGMLKNEYSAIMDRTQDHTWELWIKETEPDDNRRYEALKELCEEKSVLEFGCGNGGFLRRIKKVATEIKGIELSAEARMRMVEEGIDVCKTFDSVNKKYDVVCMFMVLEHLNNPDVELKKIYDVLRPNGMVICETPNANDALITKYDCTAFENFTYWSEHVFLFDSYTLQELLNRNGFRTRQNTQIQRYSLANHLYWLSKGKPGGHIKWTEFNEQKLCDAYAENLIKMKVADTLWYIGERQ